MEKKILQNDFSVDELGVLLLEIGSLLMISGASTDRIRTTINRISTAFNYQTDMLISQRTLMLSMYDGKNSVVFNNLKRTSIHGVNFTMISGISRMSWLIKEQHWDIDTVKRELQRLAKIPHYPKWLTLSLVACAGAAFCRLAGGGLLDMAVVFLGSFCGLFIRQKAVKMGYNPYLCIYLAGITSSLIAGLPLKLTGDKMHEHAFATSVLFLIPGVPLINSFSDMIEGNLQNGLIRGINGFIISFAIALALLTSMFIHQF